MNNIACTGERNNIGKGNVTCIGNRILKLASLAIRATIITIEVAISVVAITSIVVGVAMLFCCYVFNNFIEQCKNLNLCCKITIIKRH